MGTKIGQKKQEPCKPMKKKPNIRITPLDKMFSELVKRRAGYVCEYCGKKPHKQGLHCSHFIGRTYRNTRWELDNASCLCFACHAFMHRFPKLHTDFFNKRIGSDKVEQLEIMARSGNKVNLEEVKKSLQEKLEVLK